MYCGQVEIELRPVVWQEGGVSSCHERLFSRPAVKFLFTYAGTLSFAWQLQWTLHSPLYPGWTKRKQLSDTMCMMQRESMSSPPYRTKQSVGRVCVQRKGSGGCWLVWHSRKRKDNIAEQGREAFFSFSPLHAPHPINLSSAERDGGQGSYCRTQRADCVKIWVLWWSMWPYRPRRQRGV